MKKCLAIAVFSIILLLTVLLTACFMHAVSKRTENPEAVALALYRGFLSGEQGAKHGEETIYIDDVYQFENEKTTHRYAFFDMNGDGMPELHVRSARDYSVLTYRDSELVVWQRFSRNCESLSNGAVLYARHSIGWIYEYYVMDFYGNVVLTINFERFDVNGNDVYNDEIDECYFERISVTDDEWIALTEKYLSVELAPIDWIYVLDDGQEF